MLMRVTLKQIAEKAGVHISTVDKVLHNRPGVSDAVRANVQQIIDELGYRPSKAGRTLQRMGKQYRIAVLLLNVDAKPYIMEGIRKTAEESVFDIRLSFYDAGFQCAEEQASCLEKVCRDGCDGIILYPNYDDRVQKAVNAAVQSGIPVITVNSDIQESGRLCYVGQNGALGARIAGRMMGLLLGGSGKVAVITSAISSENCDYHVATRRKAFSLFMEENYPDVQIIRDIESFEDREHTYIETRKMLDEIPDLRGIYITCGCVDVVCRAALEAGKTDALHIVSFEDYPEILELMEQGVIDCTIGSDLTAQGIRSLQLMMDFLIDGKKPEQEMMYIDSQILVRESVI